MHPETRFINLRQTHLPDSGAGLQFVNICRALLKAQSQTALGYRAGTDQHHFFTQCAQGGNLLGPAGYRGLIQATAIVGD